MELAGGGRLHSTAAGPPVCERPAAALGATLRSRLSDADPSPSGGFGTFAKARHARQATETLWAVAREAQRPSFGASQALPSDQKGYLRPNENSERGVLRWTKSPSQNSLWLKHKLRLRPKMCRRVGRGEADSASPRGTPPSSGVPQLARKPDWRRHGTRGLLRPAARPARSAVAAAY